MGETVQGFTGREAGDWDRRRKLATDSSERSWTDNIPVVERRWRRLVFALIVSTFVFVGAFVVSAEAQAKPGGGGSADKGGSNGANAGEGGTTPGRILSGATKDTPGDTLDEIHSNGAKNTTNNAMNTSSPNATKQVQQIADHTTKSSPGNGATPNETLPVQEIVDAAKQTTSDVPPPSANNLRQATEKILDPLESISSKGIDSAMPVADMVTEKVDASLKLAASTVTNPPVPAADTANDPLTPVTDKATEPSAPVANAVTEPLEPVANTATEPLEPMANTVAKPPAPVANTVTEPSAPVTDTVAEPLAPVVGTITDPAPIAEPVFKAAVSQSTEAVAAPMLEPVLPAATVPVVEQTTVVGNSIPSTYSLAASRPASGTSSVLIDPGTSGGAVYGDSTAVTQATETTGIPGSLPRSFDGLLLGGRYDAALFAFAAVANGIQDLKAIPPPSYPSGLPSGLPTIVGSFGGSASATGGIGLNLLAVLALLAILSRADGLSWRHRDTFRLVSSQRLVAELPG